MNVAAYCRVSTDKTDQLNSLNAQKEFFARYTERTGDKLVCLYADEGISGTKIKNRKEFLRMMSDGKKGMFDMVVVKDISRFARNTVDLLQNIRMLKALGIETQFLTANMTSMGNSEFVLTIFGALAQEESANTSKRVKFGKKINAQKGRVPNIVYGYEKIPGDYFNMTVNKAEADIIAKVFNWYTEEGYGASKIAGMLNAAGNKTKRGYNWSQNAVCRILTNRLYIGQVINGRQEVEDFLTGRRINKEDAQWFVVDNPRLCIVEADVFEKAARLMKSRGEAFKVHNERQSNKYLFSTLIKCKECGLSFRRVARTYKNTYVRWVCSCRNSNGADSCINKVAVDETELINALNKYFEGIIMAEKNWRSFAAGEIRRIYKDRHNADISQSELNARLTNLNRIRLKYADMYADDLISKQELSQKLNVIKEEETDLEFKLNHAICGNMNAEKLNKTINNMFDEPYNIADINNMTNMVLKRIVEKIEVDHNGCADIYIRRLNGCEME